MDHADHPPVAGRAVVSDPPGAPSMLTLYAGDQALAALDLASLSGVVGTVIQDLKDRGVASG